MTDEGVPIGHETGEQPKEDLLDIGDAVLDAASATPDPNEWDKLQGVVAQAHEDIDNAAKERVAENPNPLHEKIKDWPEAAQSAYRDRLAAQLFLAKHPGIVPRYAQHSTPNMSYDYIPRATLVFDATELCGAQFETARQSLEESWSKEPESMRNIEAFRRATAADRERLETKVNVNEPLAGDFDGGFVALDALEGASRELSGKIMEGLDTWLSNGKIPEPTDNDSRIDKKIKAATADAIKLACTNNLMPSSNIGISPEDIGKLLQDKAYRYEEAKYALQAINETKRALSYGPVLAGDLTQPGSDITAGRYPALFGIMSVDNVAAYLESTAKAKQEQAFEEEKSKQAAEEERHRTLNDLMTEIN